MFAKEHGRLFLYPKKRHFLNTGLSERMCIHRMKRLKDFFKKRNFAAVCIGAAIALLLGCVSPMQADAAGLTSGAQTKTETKKQVLKVSKAAPRMDRRVLLAYERLGFTVSVDSSVSYAGYFNAGTKSIILRKKDDTVYHELGHFLAFVAGNVDKGSSFRKVYEKEKSRLTGVNKVYAARNSSEYFAESVKDYTKNPKALKRTRPETYKAIENAINKVTDSQIKKVEIIYSALWKKSAK